MEMCGRLSSRIYELAKFSNCNVTRSGKKSSLTCSRMSRRVWIQEAVVLVIFWIFNCQDDRNKWLEIHSRARWIRDQDAQSAWSRKKRNNLRFVVHIFSFVSTDFKERSAKQWNGALWGEPKAAKRIILCKRMRTTKLKPTSTCC